MTDADSPARPRTSTRDHAELRRLLTAWLAGLVDDPEISELSVPPSNGMSSETLLFDASWREGGARRSERCAARLRPDPSAMPVFPVYDLERQYRAMNLVRDYTRVPVPRTLWHESGDDAIGSPFFVMERVSGDVPPDIMPYPFGSWLTEADPADRAHLQEASVAVLAQLHALDAPADALTFLELGRPGHTPLRRHFAEQVAYYDWV